MVVTLFRMGVGEMQSLTCKNEPLNDHWLILMSRIDTTIWLFNIAMGKGPFIDDFPIKTSIYKGFSTAMLNNQMVDGLWRLLPSANCSSNCW